MPKMKTAVFVELIRIVLESRPVPDVGPLDAGQGPRRSVVTERAQLPALTGAFRGFGPVIHRTWPNALFRPF